MFVNFLSILCYDKVTACWFNFIRQIKKIFSGLALCPPCHNPKLVRLAQVFFKSALFN